MDQRRIMNPLGEAPVELERPLIAQVSEEIVIIVPDHFALLQDGHAGRLVAIPHGFKDRIPCIETGLHHDTAWKRLVIWRHSSFVQGPVPRAVTIGSPGKVGRGTSVGAGATERGDKW